MSTYRLKIKCKTAQFEVVAKNSAVLEYELDRYLEYFLNRKIDSKVSIPKTDKVAHVQKQDYHYMEQPYIQNQSAKLEQNYQPEYIQPQSQLPQMQAQPQFQQTPVQIEKPQVEQTPQQEEVKPETELQQNQAQDKRVGMLEKETYLSLSDFISCNKSKDVFSDFIISAYYLKRILNINYFTIKMLNSKFYPATGTLVDLSIIDEARMRGFIDSKEEDGSLKYTLSPAGESYFINQLRG